MTAEVQVFEQLHQPPNVLFGYAFSLGAQHPFHGRHSGWVRPVVSEAPQGAEKV